MRCALSPDIRRWRGAKVLYPRPDYGASAYRLDPSVPQKCNSILNFGIKADIAIRSVSFKVNSTLFATYVAITPMSVWQA